METQSRVLAMLNKTKEVREARQENLGAIEDAIKEAQNKISVQVSNFETLFSSIENDKEVIVNGMLEYAMQARQSVNNAQSFYDEYEAEYLSLTEELDALGISYDGVSTTMLSDIKNTIAYLDGVTDINI